MSHCISVEWKHKRSLTIVVTIHVLCFFLASTLFHFVAEFAQERPPFPRDDDQESVHTNYSDFDPARHNPVFYSEGKKMHSKVSVDALEIDDFDPARCHPSVVGYALVDKPTPSPPPTPQPLPPKDTCEFITIHLGNKAITMMKDEQQYKGYYFALE